ncbi:hypothetical protein F5Y16DRAFT_66184 [Xylariaceae sp. FL0255]|nr:hypothetical protein F5Y16DRAFT_66184 [Xylariaceae sp. FL0255]
MGVDPVWVILNPRSWFDEPDNNHEGRHWEHRLLGAITPDFYDARTRKPDNTKRYLPEEEGIINREINDFVLSAAGHDERTVDAKLTSYLGAKVVRASTATVDLSTKAVTFRRLDQDADYWESVRNDVSLQGFLSDWLKEAGKHGRPEVCLITGIGICQGVEFEWDVDRISKRRANAELPLDAIITVAAGSPLPVPIGSNAKMELAKVNTNVIAFRGRSSKRSVFALELKVIQRKGWIHKKITISRGPKIEDGHQLADDDDDDDGCDIDVDDLELHTMPSDLVQEKED